MNNLIIDTETTGLNHQTDKAFAVSFAWADKEDITFLDLTKKHSLGIIKNILINSQLLIGHNLKFDLHQLIQAGIPWEIMKDKKFYCTQIAEACLNEHKKSYSLDNLGKEYFDMPKIDIAMQVREYFNIKRLAKDKAMQLLPEMPIEWVAKYCNKDVEITRKLYLKQKDKMKDEPIFALEMKVLPNLLEVERRGLNFQLNKLEDARKEFEAELEQLQAKVVINTSSPIEMKEQFIKLGLDIPISEATGKPTFAKPALKNIDHPFVQDVLKLRGLRKLVEGYLRTLGNYVIKDKLYTNFHQAKSDEYGTISGRLSSSQPNMQQQGKKNKRAYKAIRSLFVAPPGYTWICFDWAAFEFRVLSHYSQDINLENAYNENPDLDFHQVVADMAGIDRRMAKTINFGLAFGMGELRLGRELGLNQDETKELFETYHKKFPTIKNFLKVASSVGAKRKYVKTILGRKIRFPNNELCYKAGALIFQGSASDIMKNKIVEFNEDNYLKKLGCELILVVHDEFNFIVATENKDKSMTQINKIMEDVPELNIPVRASGGFGNSWYEAGL